MKLLKSALIAGSWLVVSTVYAQSGPSTVANPQSPSQDQRTVMTDRYGERRSSSGTTVIASTAQDR